MVCEFIALAGPGKAGLNVLRVQPGAVSSRALTPVQVTLQTQEQTYTVHALAVADATIQEGICVAPGWLFELEGVQVGCKLTVVESILTGVGPAQECIVHVQPGHLPAEAKQTPVFLDVPALLSRQLQGRLVSGGSHTAVSILGKTVLLTIGNVQGPASAQQYLVTPDTTLQLRIDPRASTTTTTVRAAASTTATATVTVTREGKQVACVATMREMDQEFTGLIATAVQMTSLQRQNLEEEQAVEDTLTQLYASQAPQVVLLTGPSGAGKSYFLQDFTTKLNTDSTNTTTTTTTTSVRGLVYSAHSLVAEDSTASTNHGLCSLATVYARAVEASPCLLCIDDMQEVLRGVNLEDEEAKEATKLSALGHAFLKLVEQHMQSQNHGVVLVAVTQDIATVAPIFLRADRIRRILTVPALKATDRQELLHSSMLQSVFPVQNTRWVPPLLPNKQKEKNSNTAAAEEDRGGMLSEDQPRAQLAEFLAAITAGFTPRHLLDVLKMAYIATLARWEQGKTSQQGLNAIQLLELLPEDIEEAVTVVAGEHGIRVVSRAVQWSDVSGCVAVKDKLRLVTKQWLVAAERSVTTTTDKEQEQEQKKEKKVKTPLLLQPGAMSSGVLLHGPPGCGKTMLVNALSSSTPGLNFISVSAADIFSKYLGDSELKVRQLFARARRQTPCVIFLDQLDALGASRDADEGGSGSNVESRVLSTLLNEMDGIEKAQGVYVVAATNAVHTIDSALMRPGRLDVVLEVPLPSLAMREELLRKSAAQLPLAEDVNFPELATQTQGWTSARVCELCRDATMAMLRDHLYDTDYQVKHQHFQDVFQRINLT